MFPPPCIHGDGASLCPACQASYDEDASAYIEYGQHPEGLANWQRLEAEIAEAAAAGELGPHETGEHIPF